MASSLLALLDDIATILDDVAVLSKVAAKKTAGVLGDEARLQHIFAVELHHRRVRRHLGRQAAGICLSLPGRRAVGGGFVVLGR